MANPRLDGRFQKTKRLNGRKIFGYGATEAEALADLEAKAQLAQAIGEPHRRLTLHEFVESYWGPTLDGRAPSTLKRYQSAYKNHIRIPLGGYDIRAITPAIVHQWALNMAKGKNPPAPKTIDFNVATLKNIFRLAVDLDLIAKSPAVRVPIPKLPPKREKWIELEDALKVLDAVAGTELDAPVFLAMVLGLRRGEVAGLKWTDIDRQSRTVRITRQRIGTTGQNVVERELKTASSRRTLILPQNLMDGIDQRGNLDSPYVATYKGEPWVPDTIGEKWKKMAKRLGMEDWHFHDLRGQAAKLMAAAGANILEIAAVLGHNKPDMTLLYAVHRESQGETALERLGELLTSERNGTG